jgi:hypothetical protein
LSSTQSANPPQIGHYLRVLREPKIRQKPEPILDIDIYALSRRQFHVQVCPRRVAQASARERILERTQWFFIFKWSQEPECCIVARLVSANSLVRT